MKILGIETSCDETAAAVVEDGVKILSNITATSAGIHAKTGGVIPEVAARKQIKAIIPVIDLALSEANIQKKDLDAIAVTSGPGLIGSLLVGVETAKMLSYIWGKPIVSVNHLVAHIYANWLQQPTDNSSQSTAKDKAAISHQLPRFPALALVVSGGHTDLVLMRGHGKLEWLGGTRDDAAGEAFDKTARLLGFTYPGGPTLAKKADEYILENPDAKFSIFPRPMINENNLDWSFSGLKTAVLNKVKETYKTPGTTPLKLSDYARLAKNKGVKKEAPRIAAEIQEAVVDVLVKKTLKAVEKLKPHSLLLAGGVAANKRLRDKFQFEIKNLKLQKYASGGKIYFFVPPPNLCTDNAACVASCAFFNYHPAPIEKIDTNPELTIIGQI